MSPSLKSIIENYEIGNIFLINKNNKEACTYFSSAIGLLHSINDRNEEITKVEFRCYSHRSQCYLDMGRSGSKNALEDAETALNLLDTSPFDLSSILLIGEVEMCRTRKNSALNLIESVSIQSNPANDPSFEQEHSNVSNQPKVKEKDIVKKPLTCPKYQYYQNDSFMTICILEPNVKPENLQVTFEPDHISVLFEKDSHKFTVIHGYLSDKIIVEKSNIKFMEEKVLIKLKKVEKGQWHDLLGHGDMKKDKKKSGSSSLSSSSVTPKPFPTVPKTVPRPYASHRDWNAIERDVELEEESETPEGDEAVNKLFKSIYKNANEDTRRAMIKSFQTSGGTCLSTNWEEVAKTDYEKKRIAPNGQEWKTWEGDKLPSEDD